jgi:hypothetical protein
LGLAVVDVAEILSGHTHLRIYVISCVYLSCRSVIVCGFISIFLLAITIPHTLLLRHLLNNILLSTHRHRTSTICIFWLFHAHVVDVEHLLIWTSTAKPLDHVDSSAFFPVLPPSGESRWKHAYLLDPFDLLFPVHLPVPNVVVRLATLKSF